VACVLKLPELEHRDGVAEVDIGSGRIDAEFNAEWAACGEFLFEFADGVALFGASEEAG